MNKLGMGVNRMREWDHAEVRKPEGTSRVSAQLCLSP
jgi:hypothetical protein